MPTYRQVARNEFPSTDPDRRGKIDVAYAYMDEAMRTIVIQIPLEEDNEERVKADLAQRAEAAAGAGPKEITI